MLRIISRKRWGAQPPKAQPRRMVAIRDGMFVHHTVAGAPTTRAGEREEMRTLQRIAFERGFNDISYSFIIFPSGRVYEGRGVGIEGAHTSGYNSTAYGVAAAGNYEVKAPTDAMIASYRKLRRKLNLMGTPVRPHSAVYATACPGNRLRNRLGDIRRSN